VYDCNRPPQAPDAIPVKSEIFAVPGNVDLSEAARDLREAGVYLPFRELLSDTLNARLAPPLVITVHSFTPVYLGKTREVELGLLHDTDDRAARAMREAAEGSGLVCALNEPYSAADGVTHTLREHAIPRGLPNVMIEVRNDLLADATGVNRMAGLLAPMLARVMQDLVPQEGPNGK
ncbi:N-formylglutamate amidohydrolase, partial [Cribrihabitans sp. XS_ASV171]